MSRITTSNRNYATFTIKTPSSGVESIKDGTLAASKEPTTGVILFATQRAGEEIITSLKEGDKVKEDGVVAIIDTMKAAIEVRSPAAGRVHKLLVEPDATVALPGHPILIIRL